MSPPFEAGRPEKAQGAFALTPFAHELGSRSAEKGLTPKQGAASVEPSMPVISTRSIASAVPGNRKKRSAIRGTIAPVDGFLFGPAPSSQTATSGRFVTLVRVVSRTGTASMPVRNGLSKGSRTTLEAVARYRLQRRFGRGWLIGDRRVSSSTIANLERASLIREISLDGTPALILTDEGKRRLAQMSEM